MQVSARVENQLGADFTLANGEAMLYPAGDIPP